MEQNIDYLESNKNEPSLTAKITVKNEKVYHLGEKIEYEIVIKNNGNAPIKNIQISASEADTTIEEIPAEEVLEVGKSKTIQCSYINMQDYEKTGVSNGEADFTNKFTITGDAIINQEDLTIKAISTEKSVIIRVDTKVFEATWVGVPNKGDVAVGDTFEISLKVRNITNLEIRTSVYVEWDNSCRLNLQGEELIANPFRSEWIEANEEEVGKAQFIWENFEPGVEVEIKIPFIVVFSSQDAYFEYIITPIFDPNIELYNIKEVKIVLICAQF